MLKGVVCSLIGLVGVSFAAGCTAPPEGKPRQRVETPTSAAKVTSSLTTLKVTNIKTWQVYRGYGQTTALGFDKNGKPADGVRFKLTKDGKMSFKTLKRGGELVIDKNGKVTKNTLKDAEVGILYGGSSVLTSYAAKVSTGSMLPKSYRAFSGSALGCGTSALKALYGCGKLVKTCIPAVRTGAIGGAVAGSITGPGATVGAIAGGAVGAATCIGANAGEAISCGADGYEAYDSCKDWLTGEKGTSEQKAEQKAEDQQKTDEQKTEEQKTDEEKTDEQKTEEQQNTEEQNTEQQNTEEQNTEQQGCTDSNDPACANNEEQQSTEEQNNEQQNNEEQTEQAQNNEQDQVEENQNQEELDPNPQDPQVEQESQSQEPVAEEQESEQFGNDFGDESGGGGGGDVETASIAILAVKTSTSKTTAAGLGGACRSKHVMQCGVRPLQSVSYCRCVPQ